MKTIAYTALHYGKDYLGYAIRSVIDAVDEYWVLYTPVGSHGSRTSVPCPDTQAELLDIAYDAAGSKLHWVESTLWTWEGQQRDAINLLVPDTDVILVVDADEVWSEGLAQASIIGHEWARAHHVRRLRLPIIHYWRSFYRCVLHDPAFPERVIYPQMSGDTITASTSLVLHHFGYAQRPEIVEYKQLTHGHRSEWRRDCDWFHDRFMANAQRDCHPVGSQYWNPETVDPFALGLPEFMRAHPYAGMEVIE